MERTPPSWFDSPKDALSAMERTRNETRRASRLEQHMLSSPKSNGASTTPPAYPGMSSTTLAGVAAAGHPPRPLARTDQRDPADLSNGVEVQELSDSAFGRLFPATRPEVD